MNARWIWALLGVVLAAVAVGCASGPKGAEAPPDWVLSAPSESEGYTYYTGSGEKGSLGESEAAARAEITEKIMTFIGVEVTAQADTTVQATLDSYKAEMVKSIEVKGEARLKGLELVDKWVDPRDGTSVYLLARYRTADLVAEQKRLEALIREILDLVAKPEAEAQDLEDEGRYFEAATRYIQAAAAAYKLDIPNRDVKFERTINGAKTALEKLNILPLAGDNMEGVAGRELPSPFEAIVVTGSKSTDRPVPDVSVKIVFRSMGSNNRMRTETATAKSDEDGVVAFTLPVPRFVGAERVTVSLNMGPYLEPLAEAPKQYQQMIAGLEELAVQKKATFNYTTISMAREVPTGIVVVDVDAARNPLASAETAAGILEELSAQKFKVRTLKVPVDRVVGVGDAEIVAYLKASFSAEVSRVIFGVSQIAGLEKDGDKVVLKVSTAVKVVDLGTEEIRLAVDRSTSAIGSNPDTAATSAFRKVGQLVGGEIANNLW